MAIQKLENLLTKYRLQVEAEERELQERQQAEYRRAQQGNGFLENLRSNMATGYALPHNFPEIHIPPPYAEIQKELDVIKALEVEIKHHISTTKHFLNSVISNPESSPAINWALAMVGALFLIGVIYPLSFLPTPAVWIPELTFDGIFSKILSLRGGLLTAVTLIFVAALGIFAIINNKMKYPSSSIELLENFTELKTYSQYFHNAENNKNR